MLIVTVQANDEQLDRICCINRGPFDSGNDERRYEIRREMRDEPKTTLGWIDHRRSAGALKLAQDALALAGILPGFRHPEAVPHPEEALP